MKKLKLLKLILIFANVTERRAKREEGELTRID
jgi:hypothetical protein